MAKVLVTGCSAGIGRAVATRLAERGHRVFATMRDPSRAGELGQLAAAQGLPISIHRLDVDSDESVAAALRDIDQSVDVLVNNAGLGLAGATEELPLEAFRASMNTNYLGALRCIQAVLPGMRGAGSGCIINISSVAARACCAPFGAYAPTKAALEALSEILAGELRPFNVRVAIVEPGVIDTAMAVKITTTPPSRYPQSARFAALFKAVLSAPVSPDVVAATVQEIIESGTSQMRHLSGPTAEPLLRWRNSMTDEEWAACHGQDDAAWYAQVARDLGVDLRH